jgi:hypothetical protein
VERGELSSHRTRAAREWDQRSRAVSLPKVDEKVCLLKDSERMDEIGLKLGVSSGVELGESAEGSEKDLVRHITTEGKIKWNCIHTSPRQFPGTTGQGLRRGRVGGRRHS